MRILIAEDDLLSRTMLADVLKKHGHDVIKTPHGASAWEELQRPDAPALAILDWMMPQMDGLEVVRRVRAHRTDRPPYLIMLTSKTEKADIIAALDAGANDYLSKPFDHGELRTRVQVGRKTLEIQASLAAINEDLRSHQLEMEMQNEELRRTQVELAASRSRYFDLYDLAPVGYVTISEGGFILEVNITAANLLGVARGDLISQPFSRTISKEDFDTFHMLHRRLIETGDLQSCDLRMIKLDGGEFWANLTAGIAQKKEGDFMCRVVFLDITQKKADEGVINDLRQRLSMIEQEERRRIATSLHDCTVQDLVAMQLNLNRAFQMLGDAEPAVSKILGDCAALAENNANELRSLAYDLHAPWLQHGGLLPGIQAYVHQFSLCAGISVTLDAPPSLPKLQQANEISLYRVMQESLMNVHRHSSAKHVWILLSISDNHLHMAISDDGVASSSQRPGKTNGLGILSMHERMNAVGGKFDFCLSSEGASTHAILPLSNE